jgi:hypothetical protein
MMTKMSTLKSLRKSARSSAGKAYKTAMNHPKSSTAVMLGTGLAAALAWAARRNGGFAGLHKEILARVRGG